MQKVICTWSNKFLHIEYIYMCNCVHISLFAHVNKFAYVKINTHECKYIHVYRVQLHFTNDVSK